jgi:endonuclease YncB( thermonuclease family)
MELTTACLYVYMAIVTAVYDGDTVTADIDLGMHIWATGEKLRLARIDAPEVRGEERAEGLKSRDWLREKINGKKVLIKTIKDKRGKYGRFLVEIYLDGVNLNDQLVEMGLAEYREY